ncbi:hypothetical protein LLEC1_01886 [Akanthomyces lecanii]|uniref:HCP-like protein n=1 Tax=Cordyceps confragosa TaxID=2714763 RepID=A0A179ID63_CORDF|nr:hypothetical protein LLEC1_01886 [Akanthomyces lecanii]
MGLRDKLRKSDESPERHDGARMEKSGGASNIIGHNGYAPEFTFVRSDTASLEVINPGDGGSSHHHHHHNPAPAPHDDGAAGAHLSPSKEPSGLRRSLSIFHSNRSRSTRRRRLSERLHLRHHQPESSDSVPENLPAIVVGAADEAQWEQRATLLAGQNEIARSAPGSPGLNDSMASLSIASVAPEHSGSPGAAAPAGGRNRSRSHSSGGRTPPPKAVSSVKIDADIQEAIRLHEEGDLQRSTAIFGRLADTQGANNPLSQVLFGLALRHGWGCTPDTERAVTYLSAAASNAAAVEEMALEAGMKKGGAAKGELILAIFELANCFRHGWGIPKDPVAAKQYYETAANLGDTDAMNEAGWCYLEGFGCKKDKFTAARYYRLAEKAGNKTLGNSW